MRITLIAMGRVRKGPIPDLLNDYAARLPWAFTLREVEERRRLDPATLKRREGELLLQALPDRAVVVALDEGGEMLSSAELAMRLGRWRDDGAQDIAFLIGGADGLSDIVKARADLVLSLGRLTWPHLLVRPMLAEQLYRASCILSGHPYHRG